MYNSSHTSDLSSSMSSSSVSSAVSANSSETSISGGWGTDTFSNLLNNNPLLSITSVLSAVSTNLVKDLFHSGSYKEVIKVTSDLLKEQNNSFFRKARGESYAKLKNYSRAIADFSIALDKDSSCYKTHNNIGLAYKEIGLLELSANHLSEAIRLNPSFSEAYNNYGNVKSEQADIKSARKNYLKCIELDPNNAAAFWNLHSTCNDIDNAKAILELCLEKDVEFEPAVYTLATINAFKGNTDFLKWILSTEVASESTLRSISWILSLPTIPRLEFNRWSVFDFAIKNSVKSRAFYEFGVWMGESFRYLEKYYSKSFGFDTFEGLPEDWHDVPSGSYSSFGKIPKIGQGEFIVGEFSQSLPNFFRKKQPLAGLLNFDADLYSSTSCALENSKSVIDDASVLVFDELIVNENWEQDEYKAVQEFCHKFNLKYDVMCVSLFTKQVVLKVRPRNN